MSDLFRGAVRSKDWMAVGIILGCTVLLCVVFVFFIRAGQEKTLLEVRARDADVMTTYAEALTKESDIEKLRRETAKIEMLVVEFDSRLPKVREIPSLMREFERIANVVGLDVELVPLPPIRDEQLRKETIPYNITVHGDFHQIAAFINQLERYKRYLQVSDLNIDEEKEHVSKGTFTLSTFRFIENASGTPSS